ncbi:hypothetical protein CAC42_6112 [Sphaceloma murrayae]|uniref:Uncharacterized protein n=1 Tax=Sphaceloma murrayae TaxID=2082308 RepID=A0A2K1QVC8_9PEZI|nr:hypothetical protein CAC42_6112 [Sphaceloma murrayae]
MAVVARAVPAPLPQGMDLSLVDALPDPTFPADLDSPPETITYDPATILAAAAEQITATPSPRDDESTPLSKRQAACAPQAPGATGVPVLPFDNPSFFVSNPTFTVPSLRATTPANYTLTFSGLNAASQPYGYLGYTLFQTYDVAACAALCTASPLCLSFNIYFQRSPSVVPGPTCLNPPSVTRIKCALWGGPAPPSSATNAGQWRADFQLVIAGSNGYQKTSIATPDGFAPGTFFKDAAIDAPSDEFGADTYVGEASFSGPYDVALCAEACRLKTAYNLAHPPVRGEVRTCRFFNTYLVYVNRTSNVQGQYCAMYSKGWSGMWATNKGQYRGAEKYGVMFSYGFANGTDAGAGCRSCAVVEAEEEIERRGLAEWCRGGGAGDRPEGLERFRADVVVEACTNVVTGLGAASSTTGALVPASSTTSGTTSTTTTTVIAPIATPTAGGDAALQSGQPQFGNNGNF